MNVPIKVFILLTLIPFKGFSQDFVPNKIQVAILGTFHLGETSDYRDGGMDSPLSRKRQREIRDIVKKLSEFKPDQIFVENIPESQELWDDVYTNYLKGVMPSNRTILENEIFQIAIRVAALNPGTDGVTCINFEHDKINANDATLKKWEAFSEELISRRPDYDNFFKQNLLASKVFNEFIAEHESWMKLPLKEHLIKMNEEESLRKLQYFNVLGWMDNNTAGLGAEFTTRDYYRNLKIIQNMYSKLKNTDKRILIIYGAAHAKIFRDILESHPVFEIVDISKILK